eukprot:4043067-Pleurochrysis_carterae.AAC.3
MLKRVNAAIDIETPSHIILQNGLYGIMRLSSGILEFVFEEGFTGSAQPRILCIESVLIQIILPVARRVLFGRLWAVVLVIFTLAVVVHVCTSAIIVFVQAPAIVLGVVSTVAPVKAETPVVERATGGS